MTVPFNINSFVEARLTAHGARVYAASPYYRPERLTDGVLSEQAWVVMRVFGEHFGPANEQVFVDNTWGLRPDDIVLPVAGGREKLTYFATMARSAEIAVEKMRLASTDSTLRVFLALAVNSLGTAYHVLTLAASTCRESA